ncbi:uncharacterized protein [Littorina saxatilis]|uniref:uncharacterized protein n=1 Tax=Littorina saxatilis TaxID=31220 RepID=UPI0038B6150E
MEEEGDTAILSDVKIEIDVAEETPQYWLMTEPQPYVPVREVVQTLEGQAAVSTHCDTWLKQETQTPETKTAVTAHSGEWLKQEIQTQATHTAVTVTVCQFVCLLLKHEAGLRARRPHRGAVLTRRHRQNRVQWGNQHLRWTVRNHWRHVWFSDESYFLLQRHDGRRRVYRRVNERYAPNCVDEAPVHGGGGVMVWGAINTAGRSTLVHVQGRITAQRYVEEILRPHALPLLADQDAIFQQDNAMAAGEDSSSVRSASSQTSFMQAVPHGLVR